MLVAHEFNNKDKDSFLEFISEIRSYDNNFEGFKVGNVDDFDLFLDKVNNYKLKKNDFISPQITYGVFDEDILVGVFSLRFELVGCLINHGGNIGYFIRPSKRIIEYGFNDLGFNEIYLRVFSHNFRAIHCYKKLGFIEYDIVKNVKKSNGQDVDEIHMKVKKIDYYNKLT